MTYHDSFGATVQRTTLPALSWGTAPPADGVSLAGMGWETVYYSELRRADEMMNVVGGVIKIWDGGFDSEFSHAAPTST